MPGLSIELSVGVESFISNMNRAEETTKKNTESMSRRATSFINSLQRQFDSMTKNKFELDAVRASTMNLTGIEKERIANLSTMVEQERQKQAVMKQQRGAIDGVVSALEREATTVGKSKAEINDYILAQNNATEADKARVKQLQMQIDMAKTQSEWQGQETKRHESIKTLIGSIEQEQAALGKTSSQLKIMQLESLGASEAQIKQARAALDVIDANNKQSESYNPVISKLKTFAAVAIGGIGVKGAIDMMDTYSQLASRVKNATTSTEEYNLVQERLSANAKITYRDLGEATEGYLAFSTSMRSLGYNTQQTLDLTDSLSFSFTANAARADQAQSANDALAKSMAKGKVDADAWMSILMAADNVAGQIAKTMGISEAEVRKLGANGKLALNDLLQGLIAARGENEELAKAMSTSFKDAMQNLKNTTMEALGKINETYEVTGKLAKVVGFAADNIGLLTLAATGFAAANFGPVVFAQTANVVKLTFSLFALTSAHGRAAFAAKSHTIAMGSFGLSARAATIAVSGFAIGLKALAVATPYVLALTAALDGMASVIKFIQGKDANGLISNTLNEMTGGDNEKNSLGTRLFDYVEHIKTAKVEYLKLRDLMLLPLGPIGIVKAMDNAADRRKANIEDAKNGVRAAKDKLGIDIEYKLSESSIALISDIDKTSESFALAAQKAGMTSEEFELLTARAKLLELSHDDAIKAGDKVAIQKYKEAEASVLAAEASYKTKQAKDAEMEASKKKQAKDDEDRKAVTSTITSLTEKLKGVGKTADEIERLRLSSRNASAAQLRQVTALQKSIAAEERKAQVTETLKSLAERVATAGMSERQKEMYNLEQKGATAEELDLADRRLRAIEQLENASKTFDKSANTMSDAVNGKDDEKDKKEVEQVGFFSGKRDGEQVIDQKITKPLYDISDKLTNMPNLPSSKYAEDSKAKNSESMAGSEVITLRLIGENGKESIGKWLGTKESRKLLKDIVNSVFHEEALKLR